MTDMHAAPDAGAKAKGKGSRTLTIAVVLLAFFGAAGWWFLTSVWEYQARSRLYGVHAEGVRLQEQAAREFAPAPGAAAPASHDVAPATRYARRIRINPADRSIVVWPNPAAFPHYDIKDDALLRFTLGADGSWTCTGEGIAPRAVPRPCRAGGG